MDLRCGKTGSPAIGGDAKQMFPVSVALGRREERAVTPMDGSEEETSTAAVRLAS